MLPTFEHLRWYILRLGFDVYLQVMDLASRASSTGGGYRINCGGSTRSELIGSSGFLFLLRLLFLRRRYFFILLRRQALGDDTTTTVMVSVVAWMERRWSSLNKSSGAMVSMAIPPPATA